MAVEQDSGTRAMKHYLGVRMYEGKKVEIGRHLSPLLVPF